MSNALYRAECCGELAACCRVAALCTASEMRSHYLLLSEHYSTLAEAEELAALAGISHFDSSDLTDGVSRALPTVRPRTKGCSPLLLPAPALGSVLSLSLSLSLSREQPGVVPR